MLDANEDTRLFQQVTAQFDAPAFVRRARSVDDAWDRLVARCHVQRDELLHIPRLRLGILFALAADWGRICALLTEPREICGLQELFARWQPKLRVRVVRTESARRLGSALREVCDSFARFNRKWNDFVSGIDLHEINALRANYNRYYVLEKECSVRSAAIAREGFRPLEPLIAADILAEFPLLEIPQVGQSRG